MATTTLGYTQKANTDSFTPPADFNTLEAFLEGFIAESVSTASSLPASGLKTGRTIYVQDTKTYHTWNGSAWFLTTSGSITGSNGFSSSMTLTNRNGLAVLTGSMTCASGTPSNPNVMGTIPAGFRPGSTVRGAALLFASGQLGGFEITSAGQLSVFNQAGVTGVTAIYFTTSYEIAG